MTKGSLLITVVDNSGKEVETIASIPFNEEGFYKSANGNPILSTFTGQVGFNDRLLNLGLNLYYNDPVLAAERKAARKANK